MSQIVDPDTFVDVSTRDEIKTKLSKLKIKVMTDTSTFLYTMLFQLIVKVVDVPINDFIAATNGNIIWLNKELITKWDTKSALFVFCHELMHIGLIHMDRGKDKDAELWNQCADAVINHYLLREANFRHNIHMPPPPNAGINVPAQEIEGKSTEKYYNEKKDEDEDNDDGDGDGLADLGAWAGDIKPCTKDELINIVSKVTSAASAAGAGNIPSVIKSAIGVFTDTKLSWDVILQEYLVLKTQKDYTWEKPSRRFIGNGEYLPSLSGTGAISRIVVYIDTSASVSDDDLQLLYSELKAIHETGYVEEIVMKNFDTQVHKPHVLSKGDIITSIDMIGRGGTNLEPVRKDLEKEALEQPAKQLFIVMSDLDCVPMRPTLQDMVWIIIKNRFAPTPKFGKIINME